jgi:hypothetical protein
VLLEGLGVFAVGGSIWSVLFGVAFLYGFIASRDAWWAAAIPAGALLGFVALIASSELAPGLADEWGASLFLGAVGVGFWAVQANIDRDRGLTY